VIERVEAGTGDRIVVDGRPIPFVAGDSIATAVLRAGEDPGQGGPLCLAGDCGNCLAVVNGIGYVRTCQEPALPGTVARRHPPVSTPPTPDQMPPLPVVDRPDLTGPVPGGEVHVERVRTDVALIGGGEHGAAERARLEAAGREVLALDAAAGCEVVAIYPGPLIVARTRDAMLHVEAEEIVVATGAADLLPVCEGNQLRGILSAGAAERLQAAGVELPGAVAVGEPPRDVPCARAPGRLVRFEGSERVTAVVTADAAGVETRTPCRTAIVGLGRSPRDILARMSGGAPIRVVGPAAADMPLPVAPVAGIVCACQGITVDDLAGAWEHGYHEMELLKRASLAGVGTCQGGACLPHLRSWIGARSGAVPPAFTARPAARQITIAEAAADTAIDAFRRTALHDVHLRAGARMDRFSGWWRPWHYGDPITEYWAVREGVSLGDVSTLGKMVVSGPDVVDFLERLYPCRVADIAIGRSRYALLLNERGHVMDDGMIVREAEDRFVLTFTSGGAANAEMWVRDWAEAWRSRVRIMDRTMSLAAINVTGPLATTLLARAGLADPPRFLGHVHAEVAGVPCHVIRLSFTGEASFELHHPIDGAVELWTRLADLGADLGIRPHGLKALFGLRLEKGHVIVGMDTELDTTPRRIGMDWAVRMDKPDFIGRAALERTSRIPDQRRLVGLTMDGDAPAEGTPVLAADEVVGHVSGTWASPLLGRTVMLGWLKRTPFPDHVVVDGREAVVTPTPFYDPEGRRARA
jgi:glycine cleavage system T protein